MNTITDIKAARSMRKQPGEALHTIATPVGDPGMARLQQAIDDAGLASDARAIWLGYPNMEQAAQQLMRLLSADWPSRRDASNSAVIDAVLNGIRCVSAGMANKENTRTWIVANFLRGIATVAEDVAGVCAWGYQKEKPVEQFGPDKGTFAEWAQRGAFTEIRFYFAEEQSKDEIDGTRWKLLCAVANTKDVGIAHRFMR